ncbi:MAG: hypothetical protein EAZ95_13065 [Bacteroidetes bacterium]|nr:MAG: hypothetical protein EAZ95_13065 [Bacteroidota bacterium]
MLVRSFEEMLKEYEIEDLELADKQDRTEMLSNYTYSVIFEGDFLEYDNLEEWIKTNLDAPLVYLFYGKLDYDYGFFELFFTEEKNAKKVAELIPILFTTYPNGETSKTNGSPFDNRIYKVI